MIWKRGQNSGASLQGQSRLDLRGREPYFGVMKRMLFVAAVAMSLSPLFAQDAASSIAMAARQAEAIREFSERFNTLQADVEQLQRDNLALREEVKRLRQENTQLREDQVKTATAVGNLYNPEKDIKRLTNAIYEVDRKRISDRQEVTAEFNKNMKQIDSKIDNALQTFKEEIASRPVPRPPRAAPPPSSEPQSDFGHTYTVEKGQSFSVILQAYNAKFKEMGLKPVTRAQVQAVNPKVNLDKLQIGAKLIIPAPPGAKE